MPGVSGVSSVVTLPYGARGCGFELLARFDAANQGYANGQILDTEAEGVAVGRLTVVELDGIIQLLNNRCRLSNKTVAAYSDLGFYSTDAVARALGKALFVVAQTNHNTANFGMGWNDGQDVGNFINFDYAVAFASGGNIQQGSDSGGDATVAAHALNTDYEFTLVLGGYDVNRQPWYVGAVGSFIYGCSLFIQGGAFAERTLLWRYAGSGTALLYPAITLFRTQPTIQLRDFRVPIYDYSPVHQPVLADWFTDLNATTLPNHTPDVAPAGSIWIDAAGSWEIQGGRASCAAVLPGPDYAHAQIDVGISDLFLRADEEIIVVNQFGGIVLRASDKDNLWAATINDTTNSFQIFERNGGVWTSRALGALAVAPNVVYENTFIAEGQNFQAFIDGANRLIWASAFNQNATRCGLYQGATPNDVRFDNFHINRRDGVQYDRLGKCG